MPILAEEATSAVESASGVITDILGFMGDVVTTVSGNALLMAFVVGVPLLSLSIGLFKRLISSRA